MTDFSQTNIHCSSIGNIMSNGRKKTNKQKWETAQQKIKYYEEKYNSLDEKKKEQSPGKTALGKIQSWRETSVELFKVIDEEPLSDGAKTHLKRVYGYSKYGKWSAVADKGTKYTNKGTLAEQESINLISRLQGVEYVKNEERINNEYLTGIPDVFLGDNIYNAQYIIDVKSSWDIETFLDNLCKPLCTGYWWQVQGYLAITGAQFGEVSYCLVDTPLSIINHECYKLKDRLDAVTEEDPIYIERANELVNNLTFGDIPEKERRLRFLIERDEAAIQRVYNKVRLCREYLIEIEETHLQGEFLAKEPVQEVESEEENNNEDSE